MFYGSIRSAPLKASYNIFNSLLPPHNNGLRSWYLNGMLQRLLFDTSAHHPSCGIDGAAYDGSSYWYTTAGVMRNSPSHLMWFSRGERCDQLQKCRSNRPTPKQGSHHVSEFWYVCYLLCYVSVRPFITFNIRPFQITSTQHWRNCYVILVPFIIEVVLCSVISVFSNSNYFKALLCHFNIKGISDLYHNFKT